MVFLYSKSFRRNRSEEPQGDGAVAKSNTERLFSEGDYFREQTLNTRCDLDPRIREDDNTGVQKYGCETGFLPPQE